MTTHAGVHMLCCAPSATPPRRLGDEASSSARPTLAHSRARADPSRRAPRRAEGAALALPRARSAGTPPGEDGAPTGLRGLPQARAFRRIGAGRDARRAATRARGVRGEGGQERSRASRRPRGHARGDARARAHARGLVRDRTRLARPALPRRSTDRPIILRTTSEFTLYVRARDASRRALPFSASTASPPLLTVSHPPFRHTGTSAACRACRETGTSTPTPSAPSPRWRTNGSPSTKRTKRPSARDAPASRSPPPRIPRGATRRDERQTEGRGREQPLREGDFANDDILRVSHRKRQLSFRARRAQLGERYFSARAPPPT